MTAIKVRSTKRRGRVLLCSGTLTFLFWFAIHFQVHGREAQFVSILGGQLFLLQTVAHTETAAHCGHLVVELLPRDFMVKAEPAELDLHTERNKRGVTNEMTREEAMEE